jgi:hypothetical protein
MRRCPNEIHTESLDDSLDIYAMGGDIPHADWCGGVMTIQMGMTMFSAEHREVSFHVTIPRYKLLEYRNGRLTLTTWKELAMIPDIRFETGSNHHFTSFGGKTVTLVSPEEDDEDDGVAAKLVITDYSPFAAALANGMPIYKPSVADEHFTLAAEAPIDKSVDSGLEYGLHSVQTVVDDSPPRFYGSPIEVPKVLPPDKLAVEGKIRMRSTDDLGEILFDGKRIIICAVGRRLDPSFQADSDIGGTCRYH